MPQEPEHDIHLALLDALDRLRDALNLAIECCIRDIQREMKKKEKPDERACG